MSTLKPTPPSPELAQIKSELLALFTRLQQKGLVAPLDPASLNKAVNDLAPLLLMLRKQAPQHYQELTEEYKCVMVFAFSNANQNPAFKLIKDQLMNLMMMTQEELAKNPELRLTLSKLKLNMDHLLHELDKENKLSPKLSMHFRRHLEENAAELENNLRNNKIDPRPLGGNPAFARLFLDYLTLTLIDEFNFDPRTGMYRSVIDCIFPNYGGYDDPSPDITLGGDALSALEAPRPSQGVPDDLPGKHLHTPPWMKHKPTPPGTTNDG